MKILDSILPLALFAGVVYVVFRPEKSIASPYQQRERRSYTVDVKPALPSDETPAMNCNDLIFSMQTFDRLVKELQKIMESGRTDPELIAAYRDDIKIHGDFIKKMRSTTDWGDTCYKNYYGLQQ